MQKENGITRSSPPIGSHGAARGGIVTTYSLRDMPAKLIKAYGLTKYLSDSNAAQNTELEREITND